MSGHKMSPSLHPSAKPYKLMQRPETRFGQVYPVGVLNLKAMSMEQPLGEQGASRTPFPWTGEGVRSPDCPVAAQGSPGGHVFSMTSPNRAVTGWSPFQLKSRGLSIVQNIIMKRRQIGISKALHLKFKFQRPDGIFKRKSKL